MADITKSIEIIFSTTLADGGATISELGSGIEDFAARAQSAIAPLNALADTVKLVDVAIVGLGLAFGGAALAAAGQFSEQVAENGTLFNASAEQLAALKSQTLEYAAGSTQSIEQINGAVYKAISSGVEWGEAIEFVGQVEQLAVAGRGELTQTTLALTGAMNAYGASADEAGRYSDAFMKTVQLGQTTLPELAASLGQVASIAASAKVPFTDLMAAIAAITSAGVPTSEAITSIKAAISNIINPSNEAQKAAADLKIQFDANALASRGLAGVFGDVYTATGGNISRMTELFGSMEALKAVTILGADASGNFAKSLAGMADSAGATKSAFDALKAEWTNLNQTLQNNIDLMLISVGQKLGPDFSNIVREMTDVFGSVTFSLNAGAFDQVFTALNSVSSRMAAFLDELATNLPAALEQVDFGKLADSILNLSDSLAGMFDGIDISTPEGLAKAIQLVSDTIATFLNQGAGIAQVWGEALDAALPLIEAFAGMSQEAATTAGKVLGVADVLNALLPILGSVGKGLEAMGVGLELIGGVQMGRFVTGLVSGTAAANALSAGALTLGAALGSGGLVAAAGAAGYGIGTLLNDGINAVVSKLTGGESLGTLIYDLTHRNEELGTSATSAGESLRSASGGITEYSDAAQNATSGVAALGTATNELGQPINSLGQTLAEIVTKTGDWADKAVQAAAKTDFMKEAAEALAIASGRLRDQVIGVNEATGEQITKSSQAFDEMANAAAGYLEAATAAGNYAAASKEVRAQFDAYYAAIAPIAAKTQDFKTALDTAAAAAQGNVKALTDVARAAAEYEIKMEQIASNERIKTIESTIKLNIADLEANARVAIAILDNIATTYKADTDLIGDLMGQVKDGYSMADKLRIQMAEDANRRVGELHEAQMKIVSAQVEYISAKTAALNAGNPIMTIEAGNLAPHLEAMMWEIFTQIQIKMAKDGGDLLVGGV